MAKKVAMAKAAQEACPYQAPHPDRGHQLLELHRHRWLHEDGQRLITTWFERAWQQRDDEEATFEAFIFSWMSVNA